MKTIFSDLTLPILFTACEKQPDNCVEIQQIKINGGKESYFVGDRVNINSETY